MRKLKDFFFINNFWQLLVFFAVGINFLLILSTNTVLFFSLFFIFFFLFLKLLLPLSSFLKERKNSIFSLFASQINEIIFILQKSNSFLKNFVRFPLLLKNFVQFFYNFSHSYDFLLRSKNSNYFFLFLVKRMNFFKKSKKFKPNFNFFSKNTKKNYLLTSISNL